jgi:hypothetical protein
MRFLFALFSRRGLPALFGLAILSACTAVDDDGSGPGPEPQFCTREYDPVCARGSDGDRRTFANGCLADRAGYDIIRRGECRRDGGGDQGGGEPRFCTREYQPVCGRNREGHRTFDNACEADAAGYRVVDTGRCWGD